MFERFITALFRLLPCVFDASNMNSRHFGTLNVFAYRTTDPILTVVGSGYFDAFVNQLRQGDIILVSDTNVGTVDMIAVTSADNVTPVTTVNGT